MSSSNTLRISSIDIFRALTMLLMIFVNDLWSLTNIPNWLGHKLAHEDGLGLADIVFPAFLFIVGLSIPYAIKARESKNETKSDTIKHIVVRFFALIVMGLFLVNLESINDELMPISKSIWQLLMVLAFFLIWNNYFNQKAFGKIPEWIMRFSGVFILVCLAITYKSGTQMEPQWMQIHWWGILGLIGWGYLICSLVYLFLGDRVLGIGLVCLLFYLLNILEFASPFSGSFKLVVSASNYACVMSGVFASVVFVHYRNLGKEQSAVLAVVGFSLALFVFGFLTRSEWGISKIQATPSWTSICSGISALSFVLLYWVADRLGRVKWAKLLSPAGRSTLTCYLVPYYIYAFYTIIDFEFPEALSFGYMGILKSLVFSFLIIYFTGLLEKHFKIRLRV